MTGFSVFPVMVKNAHVYHVCVLFQTRNKLRVPQLKKRTDEALFVCSLTFPSIVLNLIPGATAPAYPHPEQVGALAPAVPGSDRDQASVAAAELALVVEE